MTKTSYAILFGVVALVAMAAVMLVPVVVAQDAVRTEDSQQLALARICASEGGLSRPTAGCAAIHGVISHRAERRGVSWMQQARDGSRQSFNTRRTDARRYIAFLNPMGDEPAGWPQHAWRRITRVEEDGTTREVMSQVRHAPWSMPDRSDDFRRRWLRIYERAGRVVSGEETHQCRLNGRRETPAYWGCPPDQYTVGSCQDHTRAQRAGWVRLDCGEDVRNWFYCDPRESRTCVRGEAIATEEPDPEDEQLGG